MLVTLVQWLIFTQNFTIPHSLVLVLILKIFYNPCQTSSNTTSSPHCLISFFLSFHCLPYTPTSFAPPSLSSRCISFFASPIRISPNRFSFHLVEFFQLYIYIYICVYYALSSGGLHSSFRSTYFAAAISRPWFHTNRLSPFFQLKIFLFFVRELFHFSPLARRAMFFLCFWWQRARPQAKVFRNFRKISSPHIQSFAIFQGNKFLGPAKYSGVNDDN